MLQAFKTTKRISLNGTSSPHPMRRLAKGGCPRFKEVLVPHGSAISEDFLSTKFFVILL
jgi:hypothetical protein